MFEFEIEYPAQGAAAKRLCWEATKSLVWMLPKPHNSITAMGCGFRKLRLVGELMEYDFLHRLRCDRPARLEELVCAGTLLIEACDGAPPTELLPLDELMLVNAHTFDALLTQVHARLEMP